MLAAVGGLAVAAVLYFVADRAFVDRPARGGELTEAVAGGVSTFNPLFATSDAETDMARLIHAGLLEVGADGLPAAGLASRWAVDESAIRYRFTLREDATWSDGQPLTARDVVFTARLAARDDFDTATSRLASAWALATSVTAVDDRTVEVVLGEPYAPFVEAATLGILPVHVLGDVAPHDLARHPYSTREPIGAGPWKLEVPGGVDLESLRLVRNEHHWEASGRRPFLEAITLRTFESTADAWAALGRREVQLMCGVPPDGLELLGEDVQEIDAVRSDYTLVYLNPNRVVFGEAAVRKALSLAMDRTGIIGDPNLLDGRGAPAISPIPPGSWAFDPIGEAPPYSPDEAAAILDAAGWTDGDGDGIRDRDGKALRFVLDTHEDPTLRGVAERLGADWAALGVAVEVRPQSQPNIVQALRDRAFEAAVFRVASGSALDPDLYALWHSSQAESGQNFAGYASEEADATMVALRRAPPTDLELRRELYARFQRRFVEDLPSLLVYFPTYTCVAVDPALGGVQLPRTVVWPADRYLTLDGWFLRTERIFLGD